MGCNDRLCAQNSLCCSLCDEPQFLSRRPHVRSAEHSGVAARAARGLTDPAHFDQCYDLAARRLPRAATAVTTDGISTRDQKRQSHQPGMWNHDQAHSPCLQLDCSHSRPDARDAVGACACAAAEPGADQRGQIRLSRRLSRPLRQRPAGRPGVARLPAEEPRKPVASLPIGGECPRRRAGCRAAWWRPAGSRDRGAGTCVRRCGRARDAGPPLSADVPTAGVGDPALYLRSGLSGFVRWRAAGWRPRHCLPQGERRAALAPLSCRADAGGGPQVERETQRQAGRMMRARSRAAATIRARSRRA